MLRCHHEWMPCLRRWPPMVRGPSHSFHSAAKNTDYMKKSFEWKLLRIQFNLFPYFSTLKYFKHGNLLSPLAPLWGRYIPARLLSFLSEIEFLTIFTCCFFSYNRYYWQRWTLKSIYFYISIHSNISSVEIFPSPLAPLGRYRHVHPLSVL